MEIGNDTFKIKHKMGKMIPGADSFPLAYSVGTMTGSEKVYVRLLAEFIFVLQVLYISIGSQLTNYFRCA